MIEEQSRSPELSAKMSCLESDQQKSCKIVSFKWDWTGNWDKAEPTGGYFTRPNWDNSRKQNQEKLGGGEYLSLARTKMRVCALVRESAFHIAVDNSYLPVLL